MTPWISVLIPAYNEEGLLPRALESIKNSFAAVEIPHEIIVCNNNSTDRTVDVAAKAGAKIVFEPHNQIARARNRAAEHAQGQWLLFIDADSSLSAALLQSTLSVLRTPRVCGGGALIQFDGEDTRAQNVASLLWNFISERLKWVAGSYVFCRRDVWKTIGGFDERYYAAEELIFSETLKKYARKNGEHVLIICTEKILTSSRKFKMYSALRLFWIFLLLSLPGHWKKKGFCRLWYDR